MDLNLTPVNTPKHVVFYVSHKLRILHACLADICISTQRQQIGSKFHTCKHPKTCGFPCVSQIQNSAPMCYRLIARVGSFSCLAFYSASVFRTNQRFSNPTSLTPETLLLRWHPPRGCSSVIRQCHRQVNVIVKPVWSWAVPI